MSALPRFLCDFQDMAGHWEAQLIDPDTGRFVSKLGDIKRIRHYGWCFCPATEDIGLHYFKVIATKMQELNEAGSK